MRAARTAMGAIAVAGIAAATFGAGTALARSAACKPGMTTINGVSARVFCGPAAATVTVGGKTLTLKGGSCDRSAQYVSVNVGTVLLGGAPKRPNYFGLNVGRILGSGTPASKDGTYKGSALALDYGGMRYAVRADGIKVTLSGNRSKGTFSATLLVGGTLSGSFSC